MGAEKLQMQVNFNGGIVSPFFTPRVDMAKYGTASARMENFIPRMYGSMRRRPGTLWCGQFARPTRLLRFPTSGAREFVLCLHGGFAGNGAKTESWITVFGSDGIAGGALRDLYLPGAEDAGYTEAELREVKYVSQNDVMWIVHGNHRPLVVKHRVNAAGGDEFSLEYLWLMYPPQSDDKKRRNMTLEWDGGVAGKGSEIDLTMTTQWSYPWYSFGWDDVGGVFYLDVKLAGSTLSSVGYEAVSQVSMFPVKGEWKVTTSQTKDSGQDVTYVCASYMDVVKASDAYYVTAAGTSDGATDVFVSGSEKGKQYTITGSADGWSYLSVVAVGGNGKSAGVVVDVECKYSYQEVPMELIGFRGGDLNYPIFRPLIAMSHLVKIFTGAPDSLKYIPYDYGVSGDKVTLRAVNVTRGAFSKKTGWPRAVALRGGRLIFAGTRQQPQTIWGSVVEEYDNFLVGSTADSAWDLTIGANQSQMIQWMNSGKDLIVGTDVGEWVLDDSEVENTDGSLPRIREQSRYGSKSLQGETMCDSVFYVAKDGARLRQAIYDYGIDGYKSDDMTIMAGDIMAGACMAHTIQRDPDTMWWGVTGDGKLAGLLYDRQNEVCGWCLQTFAGRKVRDVQAFTDTATGRESLAILTESSSVWRLEVMREGNEYHDLYNHQAGVRYESVWESMPMGSAQDPAVPATTTKIDRVFLETRGDCEGMIGTVSYGEKDRVDELPVTIGTGRWNKQLGGNSDRDTRVRIRVSEAKGLEVLSCSIRYTSNLVG